jgi:hypothetical protein
MSTKRYKTKEIVTLLPKIEVETANGKTVAFQSKSDT